MPSDVYFTRFLLFQFISRGYSIGRLYYDVGDNSSCRRYVEQYLNQNNNNAAAHALLGQALQKLGQKEKALEEFKTSFTICPSQNSLVLNSKYWFIELYITVIIYPASIDKELEIWIVVGK